MDDEARARAATREAVDQVSPTGLRELIDARLEETDVTPGTLTRLSARASDRSSDEDSVDRRAAGVQLIYEGLALTRRLAREPPWGEGADTSTADVEILAADVLVGRGFSLLARTDAASTAVETVRSFGRTETLFMAGRDADRSLEADVFELAIVAGVTATGGDLPADVRPFATDLAASFDPGRRALRCDRTLDALHDLLADQERTPSPPERIWTGGTSDPEAQFETNKRG